MTGAEHSTERLAQLIAAYRALSYAGLLPFLTGALGVLLLRDPAARDLAERSLIGYRSSHPVVPRCGALGAHARQTRPATARNSDCRGTANTGGLDDVDAVTRPCARATDRCIRSLWLYEHRVLGTEVLPVNYLSMRRVLTLVVRAALAIALIAGG